MATSPDKSIQYTAAEKEAFRLRLEKVRREIAEAAVSAGRSPSEITLVGVSKRFPAEMARLAVESGLTDLGENRVQELIAKMDQLEQTTAIQPKWHLIGTLQKNKIKTIVGRCHLIHSIDSLDLLQLIERRSRELDLTTDVLLQVNSSGEASKHGFPLSEIAEAARTGGQMTHVRIRGLMTMAPLTDDPDSVKPVFARTYERFSEIASDLEPRHDCAILSMGMSQDFRQAIACGATHVRIGTAIFGDRIPADGVTRL